MAEPMRLHRALARAGIASRRKAEVLIAAGRVKVNGTVAHVGQSVDPARDAVTMDGERVRLSRGEPRWIVLHKPAGVMTTRSDPEGRQTVFDLVDDVPGLTYVGRLDLLTEGVLLLTTDGDAAHRLTHPSNEVEREYVATVAGDAKEAAVRAREGVRLHDGVVRPSHVGVRPAEHGRWLLEVVISEGKKREVRRLCRALGLKLERLVRTRYGPVRLGNLPPGQSRRLTDGERASLSLLVGHDVE